MDVRERKSFIWRWFKQENGQAMVEFALVLPILLILLLGILEFGQIFSSYLLIQNASRDGARYGSVGYTDSEIIQVIQQKTSILDQTNLTVTILPSLSQRVRGGKIDVSIDYQMDLYTPMWNNILPNPFPLSAGTVMRIE